MGTKITKIRLINFKRFKNYAIEPNERMNVLVGDNEVGKSSILEAIDLVSSGNVRRVEAIGLDKLLNTEAVNEFMHGEKTFKNLPELKIELYLSGNFDHTMNGKNNTDSNLCDGIRLVCAPNIDFTAEIDDILQNNPGYFPFEYYLIRFSTFADEGYTGYKKKLRCIVIDSSNMRSTLATNDFIYRMYRQYTESDTKERAQHKSQYRIMRQNFGKQYLTNLNNRIPAEKHYTFSLKNVSSMDFEDDLMIFENEIGIDSKGTGKQVFIKTDFALERAGENVDVILIEEPENHLSPVNLRKLVQRVAETQNGQIFITTHNSLISARLELNNLYIMHNEGLENPIRLKDLSTETTKYFIKAPPANIIEYALAKKAILVEGPSEYMLLDKFYRSIIGHSPEEDHIHIIDVRGLSFKRYLEIAKLAGNKIAVITDNDGDFHQHCVEKYTDFNQIENIQIFFSEDNSKRTFEILLYDSNKSLCDDMFGENAQDYMLGNKTEAAYSLLNQENIVVPDYIQRAIQWIKE